MYSGIKDSPPLEGSNKSDNVMTVFISSYNYNNYIYKGFKRLPPSSPLYSIKSYPQYRQVK